MTQIAIVVYSLCLAASLLCAGLLIRSFRRTREPLLFWSALCFSFLAANNVAVVADMLIFVQPNLMPLRDFFSIAAIAVLLWGFIWRTE
ncbi:MAG TPA: DUF5985 family protein [Beijerinckiaceae bacterium]|nr:DUF5985 family protein [Beijerinckiaceae bacterium]